MPAGYEWIEARPRPSRFGLHLFGVFLLAAALVTLRGAHYWSLIFAIAGLLTFVGGRVPHRPAVILENGSPALTYRPWSGQRIQICVLVIALGATRIADAVSQWAIHAASGFGPLFTFAQGAVLVVCCARIAWADVVAARNRMIFGPRTLRVVRRVAGGVDDREYEWNVMGEVMFEPGMDIARRPAIEFHCPPAGVVVHSSSPGKSRTDDSTGRHVIPLGQWTVEPNSLLSTLLFLVDQSGRRATFDVEAVTAMLTPPSAPRIFLPR